MRWMKAGILTLVLAVSFAAAGRARAQDDEAVREKVRERIKALRAAKLVELLELDEATATKLFPILNKYDEAMAPLLIDNGKARRELKQLLGEAKIDEAKVNKIIDRMIANRAKLHELEEKRLREIRKVLTPAQMAKAVIVLPQIDRWIEKQIRKAVQKRGRGHGHGRGQGQGQGQGGGGGDFDDDDEID